MNLRTLAVLVCFGPCPGLLESIAAPFVPPTVAPGSAYQLAFVTSGQRDATSTNISDYNAFVSAQAANNPALTGTNIGVQYFAIGSTSAVDAGVNAPVTAPVYNFAGQLVATGSADMWDGTLVNAILYDEFAAAFPWEVWSGTATNGVGGPGTELGTSLPWAGVSNFATGDWIYTVGLAPPAATPFSFYGLSEELTAPNIPEPSTAFVLMLGLAVTATMRRRRRDRSFPASSM